MCDCSTEYAEFFSSTKRRARKEHKCGECRDVIRKGELYIRYFGVFEGDPFCGVECMCCSDWRSALAERADCRPSEGELRSCLLEEYEEMHGFEAYEAVT